MARSEDILHQIIAKSVEQYGNQGKNLFTSVIKVLL
jgi:hypothetical protein